MSELLADRLIAGAIGAIIAALIAALIALYNSRKQRDAEAYRHFGVLALQAALTERATQVEALKAWNAAFPAERTPDPPEVQEIEIHLIDKLALIQQFGDGLLTSKNLMKRLQGYRAIRDRLTTSESAEDEE